MPNFDCYMNSDIKLCKYKASIYLRPFMKRLIKQPYIIHPQQSSSVSRESKNIHYDTT
jgi:hypothetical protein